MSTTASKRMREAVHKYMRDKQDYNLSERACPFCHRAPRVRRDNCGYHGGWEYSVRCDRVTCKANPSTIWCKTKEAAVKIWNGEKP